MYIVHIGVLYVMYIRFIFMSSFCRYCDGACEYFCVPQYVLVCLLSSID